MTRAVKRGPLTKAAWWSHRLVYRASGGRLGSKVAGMPILDLTTTGRRSGRRRHVLLTYLEAGDNFVVVGSNAGDDRHPAWWLNLEANPHAIVQVKTKSFGVKARLAGGDEREALWKRAVEATDAFAQYALRTQRAIPVVVLEPTG